MNLAQYLLRSLAGSALAGFAAGTIAAVATAKTTDSIQTPSQALILVALLGLVFSAIFAALGLVLALLADRLGQGKEEATEERRGLALRVGVSLFLLWGTLVGGLYLHDIRLGDPVPGLILRPLLVFAAVLAASYVSRVLLQSRLAAGAAWLAFPLLIGTLTLALVVPRAGAADVVQAPVAQAQGKVLLIGLDGADWDRMTSLVDEGRLPTFQSFVERSYKAPLETLRPTYSPIIWTTVMSGTEEYDHGIHRFTSTALPGLPCGLQGVDRSRRLPPKLGLGKLSQMAYRLGLIQLRPISGCHRRKMNLWNILDEAGQRSTIVSWYVSWPADPINGYLVSDYNPARAQFYRRDLKSAQTGYTGITHPEDLLADLAALDLPPLDARPSETLSLPFFQDLDEQQIRTLRSNDRMLAMFRTIYSSDVFASKSFLHLLEEEQTDFMAFYMSGIDNVSHRWSKDYPPVVDRYYEWADDVLRQVFEKLDEDTTVILVSDHGWDYGYKGRWGHGYGPDGVFMALGPGIEPWQWTEASGEPKPSIYDVAPTVLSLFGLPAAEDMRGRVLGLGNNAQWANLERIATYGRYVAPPLPEDSVNEEGADETMEKLKALGYLD